MAILQQLFVAPYQPFPPGIGWASTQEMLEEAFQDLRIPWVQDFILRSHPKQDVHAVSDPSNYSRAVSSVTTFRTNPLLSGGFSSDGTRVRLKLPVISIGSIGVGVGIERTTGSGDVFVARKDHFVRFVSNNENNSVLDLHAQPVLGTIGATHYAHTKSGLWVYATLRFNYRCFMGAFDKQTRKVDFQILNLAFIQTVLGCIQHPRKPTIKANHLYPNKVANNIGQHFGLTVLCSHANGQAMMSIPVFSDFNWSYDYDAAELESMRSWGIADRVRLAGVPVPRNMPEMLLIENMESRRNGDIIDHAIASQEENLQYLQPSEEQGGPSDRSRRQRAVPIAPFPQPQPLPLPDERPISRKEARQIRKRETAARSYRRKREAQLASKHNS